MRQPVLKMSDTERAVPSTSPDLAVSEYLFTVEVIIPTSATKLITIISIKTVMYFENMLLNIYAVVSITEYANAGGIGVN